MKNTKKNNKGFSLVELIVVVLIMAILAVALAPQVMKWVDRSRQATDLSSYDSLIDAAQLSCVSAVPEHTLTVTMSKDNNVSITNSGTSVTSSTTGNDGKFVAAMERNLPGYASIKIKANVTSTYAFTIDNTGKISKTFVPGEVSAD